MWFLQAIKASVYDPVFYRSIRERKTFSAFGYFALVILIIAIISSAGTVQKIAAFVFQPSAEKDAIRQQVLALYPDELQFKVGGGKLSMNAKSPYIIPMPESMKEGNGQDAEKLPKNLLAINTDQPISESDFKKYDTLAVLSADSVGFLDQEKGKVQIQSLEKVFDSPFSLDKSQFVTFVGSLEKLIKGFGIALMFLIPLFICIGMLIWYPIYLVFGAFIVWIAARFRGADWEYSAAYKASLYFIALPLVYHQLVASGIIEKVPVPLFFTIILFVVALFNISREEKKGVPAPVTAAETPVPVAPVSPTPTEAPVVAEEPKKEEVPAA